MLLTGKRVAVFAATGAISSEVARQSADAGAVVNLSGRDRDALDRLADQIRTAGGQATVAVVDAADPAAVDAYVDRLAADGGIDAVFNGIGPRAAEAAYCVPSGILPFDRFLLPIDLIAGSTFLTARAAARHMTERGGSIVTLSASLSGLTIPMMAGITAACGAVEALTRSLAGEYGPAGVRVNCVRANAMPETRTIQETNAQLAKTLGVPSMPPPEDRSALGQPITVADTAATVVHLFSDKARHVSAQVLNVCGGLLVA